MNHPNFYLKGLLIQKDGKLVEAARALDMREDRLSRIIHCRVNPSIHELNAIAQHLNKPVADIFGEAFMQ